MSKVERALESFIPNGRDTSEAAAGSRRAAHGTVEEPSSSGFVPSKTWGGVRKGYYFGTGVQGTGYYIDVHQIDQKKVELSSRPKKSVTIAEDNNEMKLMLEELEKGTSGSTIVELTAKGVLAAAKSLESIYKKNSTIRAKFPNEPTKYMDSEVALYEQLTTLVAVATDTSLYKHVENSNLMPILIQLLGHENSDISASVVSLFLEWVDPSLATDDPGVISILKRLGKVIILQAWESMVINLSRYQSDDDTQDSNLKGVDNTLSLLENLMEVHTLTLPEGILDDETQSAAGYMARESGIFSWLFQQLESPDTSQSMKSRCMELLAFASQNVDVYDSLPDWASIPRLPQPNIDSNEPASKKPKIGKINGVEILLQAIAQYRKKQPQSDLEIETLENASLSMSSCMALSKSNQNVSAFLEAQGVELVVRCLKERVHAGGCCLKLLDFDGNDQTHKMAAESIVSAGGLKYLFPIFSGIRIPKPAQVNRMKEREKLEWYQEATAQTIRILYALTVQLDETSPVDAKSRFVAKFVDDGHKNCDRLVELLFEYDKRARVAEYKFLRSASDDEEKDEEQLLAAFDAKLGGGGDLFHRLAAITACVCINSKRCHERIISQLKMQQSGLSLVKDSLTEFATALRNDGHHQKLIETLLKQI
jgi:beta-catenin-like protein 1